MEQFTVTITFECEEENLQDVLYGIDAQLSNDDLCGGFTITEDTPNVSRVISIEIDNELFDRAISPDYTHWSFDYDDLFENKEVFDYLMEQDEQAVKDLETGKAEYIEVYKDI